MGAGTGVTITMQNGLDDVARVAMIDASISASTEAGTLVSFKSEVNEVKDEKIGYTFIVRVAKVR